MCTRNRNLAPPNLPAVIHPWLWNHVTQCWAQKSEARLDNRRTTEYANDTATYLRREDILSARTKSRSSRNIRNARKTRRLWNSSCDMVSCGACAETRRNFHSARCFFRCRAFMTERKARESCSPAQRWYSASVWSTDARRLVSCIKSNVSSFTQGPLYARSRLRIHPSRVSPLERVSSAVAWQPLREPRLPETSMSLLMQPRVLLANVTTFSRAIRAQTYARSGDGRLMANAWHDKGGKNRFAIDRTLAPLISSRLVSLPVYGRRLTR